MANGNSALPFEINYGEMPKIKNSKQFSDPHWQEWWLDNQKQELRFAEEQISFFRGLRERNWDHAEIDMSATEILGHFEAEISRVKNNIRSGYET